MGTRFEQDVVTAVLAYLDEAPNTADDSVFGRLLVTAALTQPSFTVRGGTSEVLKSVASPKPGSRGSASMRGRGRSGESMHDLAAILHAQGRFGAPAPVAETATIGGWLLAEAAVPLPAGPVTMVDGRAEVQGGRLLAEGSAAWGRFAERIVAAAGPAVFSVHPGAVTIVPGANLAGEPRASSSTSRSTPWITPRSTTATHGPPSATGARCRAWCWLRARSTP